MKCTLTLLIIVWQLALAHRTSASDSLWSHLQSTNDLGETRDMTAEWADGTLRLTAQPPAASNNRYAWAVVPAPTTGWDLATRASVEAEIINRSDRPVDVIMWVVGDRGWDAVPDAATLGPNESRRFSCSLRHTYPDQTPKVDPTHIKQVQFMITGRVTQPVTLEVRELQSVGTALPWQRPPTRLDVPPVTDAPPRPGQRVRYRLADDEGTSIYSVLNLPEDWQAGKSYPVIVEYPGNIFFVPACYSTGLPEQCVIGYGMTKGTGAICVGLPFIDRAAGVIAEDGWGNADDTADYAVNMVEEVCSTFGGDRNNIVLTGFSRGALACGYIGLRNDRIATLWKGFHACQHYDGDGWRGATRDDAIQRAARFRGKAVFQTDNSQEQFQLVMDAMKTEVTWADSGLGAHATAMFLDDRPPTQQLREW
ncbi:MAG TPA: hypothetical protein P5307_18940, partial [Pirellulaceae bacterium]|nr:hypothetical protein [Pirellulaceae bacterium]